MSRYPSFEVFLSYNRRDQRQVELVACALRERGLNVFLDSWYLAPGKSWAQELEEVLNCARAAAVFVGPGEMGPWQQREKNFALDRQVKEPAFPVIPVLLPGSDPALGFLGQNTWIDFRLGLHDEYQIERLAAAIRGEALGPSGEDSGPQICPYRGLLYFREEDAPFFFGREIATKQLRDAVSQRKFVAVVGASGSGKSSVVRAGLVPALRSDNDAIWEIVTLVPTDRPLFQLARGMLSLLKPDTDAVERSASAARLADHFAQGTIRLRDLMREALESGDAHRVLLIADQWEELYTLTADEEMRRRFIDELLDAAESGLCNVVLTLRGDFVGRALAYRQLSDRLQGAQVNLGPMTRAELESAVKSPAQRVGLEFEPGLVERILDDVGDEPGNLPLLEFVLKRLWESRRVRVLLHSSYDAMGQLRGALATKAEQVFAGLSEAEQQAAQRLFLQLVRPGAGVDDTRRRASVAELGSASASLLRKLSDERLLVTGSGSTMDEETVEVSHEALIQNWGRLKDWLNEDRQFLLWREWLRGQLAAWVESRRDEGGLLRGALLTSAERWSTQRAELLKPQEHDYIARSVELREREEQERLRQELRERDLEHSRTLAQEQQRRADAEALRAQEQERAATKLGRHRRALIIAISTVGVLAFALVYNLREQGAAKDRHARAYSLAVAASRNLPHDPELATLLALKSGEETFLTEKRLIPEAADKLRLVMLTPTANKILDPRGGDLHAVAFHPGTDELAIAGKDMKVNLWSAGAGRPVAEFGESAIWRAVAFSHDGNVMAAGAENGRIHVWEMKNGRVISVLRGHAEAVFDVKLSADGTKVFSGGKDGTARAWDVATAREVMPPMAHRNKIYRVAVAPDGQRIATACADRHVYLWTAGKTRPSVLPPHGNEVYAVAFSTDGKLLASADRDGVIAIWDPVGERLVRTLIAHTDAVTSVEFSADGRYLVSTSMDRSVRVWNPSTGMLLETLYGHTDWVMAASFSSDGRWLASVGGDKKARIWNTSFLQRLLPVNPTAVLGIAFNRDGSQLATGSFDGVVRVWDVASGRRTTTLPDDATPAQRNAVNAVAFSPLGDTIASASDDHSARLWRASSGAVTHQLSGHRGELTGVSFSADGRYIATSSKDHTVIVWDAASGKPHRTLKGHQHMVFAVAFSPDGRRIATGSFDGTSKIWDVEAESAPVTLPAHKRAVSAVAFAPDAKTLATGDWDGAVRLWHVTTRQELKSLRGHTNSITGLAFSSNKTELVSASRDGSVRLWDIESGKEVGSYSAPFAILGVAFAPDGKIIAIAQADGLSRLIDVAILRRLSDEKLLAAARAKIVRSLTGDECKQYLGAADC